MYQIGRVYIWQGLAGPDAIFNGMETTVTGPTQTVYHRTTGQKFKGQPTETPNLRQASERGFAVHGRNWLRPKEEKDAPAAVRELAIAP